jgi:hypothetical protein
VIPGIEFDFGSRKLILPPLSLGSLELLQKRLEGLAGGLTVESVATAIDATHAALKRNYPAITREEVADLIGLENMNDVIVALMDVAGLKRKEIEQGKARAAQQSTGEPSTAT